MKKAFLVGSILFLCFANTLFGQITATISVSPPALSFTAVQSGALPSSQTLQITNTGSGTLTWGLAESPPNIDWLEEHPVGGYLAAGLTANVAVWILRTNLPPGTYYDTLKISGNATNSPVKVPVTFTVTSPITATISVSPPSLSFTAVQSGPLPAAQTLDITNSGSGTLNWSISSNLGEPFIDMDGDGKYDPTVDRFITCNCPENQDLNFNSKYDGDGATWLAPTPVSGTAPYSVTVAITRTNPPGTYPGKLTILGNATNSPQEVPVAYTVTSPLFISVAPESLLFNANQGGSNPGGQDLSVTTSDQSVSWSTSKSQNWISLNSAAGTGNGQFNVSLDISGLSTNDYFDTLEVTAPSASNSPRLVPVHLHLGPALTPAALAVTPDSLEFLAQANQTLPPKFINITNGGQLPLNWSATILHGANWLSISPGSGTNDGSITVTVTTNLTPSSYRDTIKIEASGALNSPRYIPVILRVSTDVKGGSANRPKDFVLYQNYPNPFNPSTKIDFALPTAEKITLEVFNIIGERVRILAGGEMPAGKHSVVWDGRDESGRQSPSGIYFYRLKAATFVDIKRAVFLK